LEDASNEAVEENLPRLQRCPCGDRGNVQRAPAGAIENSILELTYQQARDKQRSLRPLFRKMAGYYANKSDSTATNESLVKYCFSRFAGFILRIAFRYGRTVFGGDIKPESYLMITDG
jgi:hypothetical protein